MAAATQHREKRVANRAFQRASGKTTIGLHVADFGLDRCSSPQIGRQCRGQTAPRAADQNLGLVDTYVGLVGAQNVSQITATGICLLAMGLLVQLSGLLYHFVETPPIRFGKWLIARRNRPLATPAE